MILNSRKKFFDPLRERFGEGHGRRVRELRGIGILPMTHGLEAHATMPLRAHYEP